MSDFPIILIPSSIQRAKLALPPIPTFTEPTPKQPGAKPQKINYLLVAIEAALAIVFSAAMSSGSAGLGFLSFLSAAGAIAFQTWQQIKTYPQRKRDYQREVSDYPKKLEDYDRKKRQHEEENTASQTPERIDEFRYNLLRDVLSRTSPHDGDRSIATRGWSEARFGDHLRRYFPSKIYSGLVVRIPNFDHPYTPDFTYIDSSLNLYIDIEVDEPYAYNTKEPTHFLEAWKDDNRNKFFLGRGWLVIRFSEEQVVRHPQSCCKTIAQAIASVLGDTSVLNQFANTPDLQPMRQWTQSEAEDMATNDYRDTYLQQPSNLADGQIEVRPQLPVISLPKTRARSRGAARAARRAVSSTSSSNTTDPRPLPSLTNCPYCGVKVQPTNLESHKTAKCPRRPA
ncbi:PDDEXK family nuclease [Aliterella atlantica]|uniref:hypothetical protein n=1 Tax=Aliterella atlantica TaxID=1827278 RepID=UPI000695F985|nr:hypothetical protein [Aliterella atlantica]